MSRMVGTVSRGVRAPIIREGDDLKQIVTASVLAAAEQEGFAFHDRDIVAMTEAIVARAQGNYATVDDIAADVKEKLGEYVYGMDVECIEEAVLPLLKEQGLTFAIREGGRTVGSGRVTSIED